MIGDVASTILGFLILSFFVFIFWVYTVGIAREVSPTKKMVANQEAEKANLEDKLSAMRESYLAYLLEHPKNLDHKDDRIWFERKQRAHVFVKTSGECFYCGINLLHQRNTCSEDFSKYWEVEHIWPVYLFGTNEIANLTPACSNCNREKGRMLPLVFIYHRWLKLKKSPSAHAIRFLQNHENRSLEYLTRDEKWKKVATTQMMYISEILELFRRFPDGERLNKRQFRKDHSRAREIERLLRDA